MSKVPVFVFVVGGFHFFLIVCFACVSFLFRLLFFIHSKKYSEIQNKKIFDSMEENTENLSDLLKNDID